jgi:hypothetical protein
MKPMTRLMELTQLWFPSDIDLHKIAYRLVIACRTATCTAPVFESEWN